jgi:hypothetical protein
MESELAAVRNRDLVVDLRTLYGLAADTTARVASVTGGDICDQLNRHGLPCDALSRERP